MAQDEDLDADCERTFYRRRIAGLAMSEHVVTPIGDALETLTEDPTGGNLKKLWGIHTDT